MLKIGDHRLRTGRAQLGGVLRIANQTDRDVPARGEQPLKPQRDLPMSTSDDYAHGF